jgi:hypothetical protein
MGQDQKGSERANIVRFSPNGRPMDGHPGAAAPCQEETKTNSKSAPKNRREILVMLSTRGAAHP